VLGKDREPRINRKHLKRKKKNNEPAQRKTCDKEVKRLFVPEQGKGTETGEKVIQEESNTRTFFKLLGNQYQTSIKKLE